MGFAFRAIRGVMDRDDMWFWRDGGGVFVFVAHYEQYPYHSSPYILRAAVQNAQFNVYDSVQNYKEYFISVLISKRFLYFLSDWYGTPPPPPPPSVGL